MDIVAILVMVASKYPVAAAGLGILGSAVVMGQIVVVATPTKKDDEAWDKIKSIPVLGALLSALTNFAVIQKK